MYGEPCRQIHSNSLRVEQYDDYISEMNLVNEISAFFRTGDTLGTRCMSTL